MGALLIKMGAFLHGQKETDQGCSGDACLDIAEVDEAIIETGPGHCEQVSTQVSLVDAQHQYKIFFHCHPWFWYWLVKWSQEVIQGTMHLPCRWDSRGSCGWVCPWGHMAISDQVTRQILKVEARRAKAGGRRWRAGRWGGLITRLHIPEAEGTALFTKSHVRDCAVERQVLEREAPIGSHSDTPQDGAVGCAIWSR